MNATQTKWLRDNGIQTTGEGNNLVFWKGKTGLSLYNRKWQLERQDHSEDSDGSIHLGEFGTLKDALAALRAA